MISSNTGAINGFILPYFFIGMALVGPPLLIATLLTRNIVQQITNPKNYLKLKNWLIKCWTMMTKKKTIKVFFSKKRNSNN